MFNGDRALVWEDENVLETDGVDGLYNKHVLNAAERALLESGKNREFCVMYILP